MLKITEEIRDKLLKRLEAALQTEAILRQQIRQNQQNQQAEKSLFLLELLEVIDALDNVLDSLEKNPEVSPELYQRLPRIVGFVQRKLLNTLAKQGVEPIEMELNHSIDINTCCVIESQARDDVPAGTLLNLLKKGYCHNQKVLRPAEVVASKEE